MNSLIRKYFSCSNYQLLLLLFFVSCSSNKTHSIFTKTAKVAVPASTIKSFSYDVEATIGDSASIKITTKVLNDSNELLNSGFTQGNNVVLSQAIIFSKRGTVVNAVNLTQEIEDSLADFVTYDFVIEGEKSAPIAVVCEWQMSNGGKENERYFQLDGTELPYKRNRGNLLVDTVYEVFPVNFVDVNMR
ncbi:MAG: hypothetical protein RL660_3048 [Bacteroidota bacterium]|jgi:hypothetical protein